MKRCWWWCNSPALISVSFSAFPNLATSVFSRFWLRKMWKRITTMKMAFPVSLLFFSKFFAAELPKDNLSSKNGEARVLIFFAPILRHFENVWKSNEIAYVNPVLAWWLLKVFVRFFSSLFRILLRWAKMDSLPNMHGTFQSCLTEKTGDKREEFLGSPVSQLEVRVIRWKCHLCDADELFPSPLWNFVLVAFRDFTPSLVFFFLFPRKLVPKLLSACELMHSI